MNKIWQMAIFALVFSGITAAIHYYIWHRLVKDASMGAPWRQISTGLIIALGVSIPVVMFVTRAIPPGAAKIVSWFPLVWQGAMLLFLFALLTVDVAKLVTVLIGKFSSKVSLPEDPTRRVAMGRLIAGGVAVAVGGLTTASVAQAAKKASVYKQTIALSKFPAALNGLSIVQLSDIHIGLTITKEWLADVVDRTNALNPDIIVITGDLIDGFVEKLKTEIAPLGDLKAKYGVYVVTGNHEYYFDAPQWVAHLESLGIRVLRNERVEIGRGEDSFYLAGVDDYNAKGMAPGHGPDLKKALEGRSIDKEVILLAHQPREISNAAQMDVGLLLSGHTHGGQIWPFTYLVGLQQPYNKGLYQHNKRTQVYVNQGTGLWGPPMRLGTQSEITYIELKRG